MCFLAPSHSPGLPLPACQICHYIVHSRRLRRAVQRHEPWNKKWDGLKYFFQKGILMTQKKMRHFILLITDCKSLFAPALKLWTNSCCKISLQSQTSFTEMLFALRMFLWALRATSAVSEGFYRSFVGRQYYQWQYMQPLAQALLWVTASSLRTDCTEHEATAEHCAFAHRYFILRMSALSFFRQIIKLIPCFHSGNLLQ